MSSDLLNETAVEEFHETAVPYSTSGVYGNYLDTHDDDQLTAAYWENYERLRDCKAEWDPHNMFSVNQNIEPAGVRHDD